ncbi:MAG: hypothetical protein R2827_06715 [Bdellovibrionales bacterium]
MDLIKNFDFQENFLFIALGVGVAFLFFFLRMVLSERNIYDEDQWEHEDSSVEQEEQDFHRSDEDLRDSNARNHQNISYVGSSDDSSSEWDEARYHELLEDQNVRVKEIPEGVSVSGVKFNFSGHTFDAFEALGISENAKAAEVERAYFQALASVDKNSREFIELAYLAIQQNHKKTNSNA